MGIELMAGFSRIFRGAFQIVILSAFSKLAEPVGRHNSSIDITERCSYYPFLITGYLITWIERVKY
jgi:hypothetical protein